MFSVYYHWITKYQWITILCILLFFLFVSINKKECFSVGFESDISISSNLFLKDVCNKLDNGLPCISNASCLSDFCYPTDISASKSYTIDPISGFTCQDKSTGTREDYGINYNLLPNRIYNAFDNSYIKNTGILKTELQKYKNNLACKNNYNNNIDLNMENNTMKKFVTEENNDIKNLCDAFYSNTSDIWKDSMNSLYNNDQDRKYFTCLNYLSVGKCIK